MKKISRIIAVNLIVFISLIVGIEILAQLAFAIKHGRLLLMTASPVNSKIFEIHPYLAGAPKASIKIKQDDKTITTTYYNTRWTGASSEDSNLIRIAILGGSTAFGTGVTDEDSWPALLQQKLGKQYAVINYGVPGYSTAEAIIQMALIVPEKQPHIVIFYEGWNDIRNYHEQNLRADYYGHGIRQYGNLGVDERNFVQRLRDMSATVRLAKKISGKVKKNNISELFDTPDPFVDKIYVRNLNTLKILSQRNGSFSIFIPQVLNYENYLEDKENASSWSRHIRNKSMPALMDRFNSLMNNVCLKNEKDCIILSDIPREEWYPDDFVDDGHLSRKGGIKFSDIVCQFIIDRFSNKPANR